ncbi:hypothetical protein OND84_000757 [Morganella morganii]|nr:hypothetical protein [Morganella morganii]
MNKQHIPYIIAIIPALFLIYPSIVYLINSYLFEASAFFNLIVALATAIICFYTVKSVKAVIASNNENRDFNIKNMALEQEKFDSDIFEKRFSTLLSEHEYYLKQLLDNENKFYDLSKILKLSGYESLSIIRGKVFFDIINEKKYIIYENELYISIDSVLSLHEFDISSEDYKQNAHIKLISSFLRQYKASDYFLCEKGCVYRCSHDGVMVIHNSIDNLNYANLNPILYSIIIKHMSGEIKNQVLQQISLNNSISKNILSPYMRIIYHILKLSHNHALKTCKINKLNHISHEMKKSTNIIRSMIPNNILALIAINSAYFYKNKYDESGVFSSSEISSDNENIESKVFNDYKKYYNLLIISNFFEHLYLEKKETYITYYSNCFQFDFDKAKSFAATNKNAHPMIIVTEYKPNDVVDLYHNITDLIYSNTTKELLYLFYIKNNSDYNEKIIKNINSSINSFQINNQLEFESNDYKNSLYIKDENKLILGHDFALTYVNGELISGLKHDEPI